MAGEEPNTGAAQPQAGSAAQPQAGTTAGGQEPPAAGQAPAAEAQPGTEDAKAEAARLARENADLLKEVRGLRAAKGTLEAAQRQAVQAGMSEAEKAQARATELERSNAELAERLKEQAVRTSAVEVATRLGFRSPDLAYRLIERGALEYDESGQPKNVEKLLAELLRREPYLGKGAAADYGGGNRGATPGTAPTMDELLRAAFKG